MPQVCARFPRSEVYAFEPFPETFAELKRNTSSLKKVRPFNLAFGAVSGMQPAFAQADSEWNSLVPSLNSPASTGQGPINITVRTVDEFCAEHSISNIGLLKTDTEGFDLQVLRGAERMLRNKSVGLVLSEAGFNGEDLRHTNFMELFEYLSRFNFALVGFYDGVVADRALHFCNALFASRSN